MKEIPILFSAPMVRAILENHKTQTRRIVKWQNPEGINEAFTGLRAENLGYRWALQSRGLLSCWTERAHALCPYGKPGDRLWVREAFNVGWLDRGVLYKADGGSAKAAGYPSEPKFKPSIHMPRWAARITLEVTKVRVQRLQDISEEDCLAEGIHAEAGKDAYRELWESINGEGSWEKNPWVWAVSFRRAS